MSNENHSNILSVSARILMTFAFVFGQTAWARQNQGSQNKSDVGGKGQAQQAQTAAPQVAPTKAQPAEEEEAATQSNAVNENSTRGGHHEGIKVHGHWTIEVRNPDGSLVTHREFENSLVPGNSGGGPFLSLVLSRGISVGTWEIQLLPSPPSGGNTSGGNFVGTGILLDEPGNPLFPCSSSSCSESASLSVSGGGIANHSFIGGTLTLTGSGTVPPGFGPTIGFVGTLNDPCSTNPLPQPPVCSALIIDTVNNKLPVSTYFSSFTGRTLDGLNGDPQPVSVSAGQTVAVTVNITFS